MALAADTDVETALGRDLTDAEAARVDALLDEASDLVIGFKGNDFEPAPYPDRVVRVVAGMVARVFTRGTTVTEFADQQTAGPFSVRFSADSSSGGVWMTRADKIKLRGTAGGLTSTQLVGDRYEIDDEES